MAYSTQIKFNNLGRTVGAYLFTIFLCLAILTWILKLWKADISIPFSLDYDSNFVGMLVKSIMDNGWYQYNPHLGAPDGQYMYDFPQFEVLDFILIKLISILAHNYVITLNLYFLLTFPLTSLTAMLVLRQFKVSYASSIFGSLLFAFIPYHFLRGEPHLFLADYFMIPLIIMVILWVFAEKSLLFNENKTAGKKKLINKKFAISSLICILISFTFVYYPFFSCFFLLIAGITSYVSQRNKYPLLNSFILISIIFLGVIVNATPTLIYQYEYGKNTGAVIRSPAESEIYGLKISQLIMPINGHRIPLLAKLSGYYSATAPLVDENSLASLGLIGSIGFLVLIAWAFYRISNGLIMFKINNINNELNELSILNLSAILLATIGGFGTVFAYLITPQIRGYNRISIFIAFFALFAVVLLLEEFSRKYVRNNVQRLLFSILMSFMLVAGVLDQTSDSFVPAYTSIKAQFLNDGNFINNIEACMPENAMIFQLPYVPFPESPPVIGMPDYSHLKAYLHSKDLHWSYGAMKGRPGDKWQKLVAGMPTEEMIKTLSQAGFDGIYIDSYGFQDYGAKLIPNISEILRKEPLVSADKRLYFFDMTTFNRKLKLNIITENIQNQDA